MSHFNKKLLRAIFIFVAVVIISGTYSTKEANALVKDLIGWGWSSNIGWISFNSTNAGAQSGGSYKVTVDDSTGFLSGHAWSSNIGWIKFDGLSAFPDGSSATAGRAKINFTDGAVTGWIRACSGTVKASDPYLTQMNYPINTPTLTGDCSTMTSRPDGWDGWIHLSGTNHLSPDSSAANGGSTKGVSLGVVQANDEAYMRLTGYAWGSDIIGWLNFHSVCVGTCFIPEVVPVGLNFEASKDNGASYSSSIEMTPGTFTLRWIPTDATSCLASGEGWTGSKSATSGSHTQNLTYNTLGSRTLLLTCSNDDTSIQREVNVNIVAELDPESVCVQPANTNACPLSDTTSTEVPEGQTTKIPKKNLSLCPQSAGTYCQYYCKPGFTLRNNKCAIVKIDER